MRKYRATIGADRYSLDFNVEASNWPAATARAIRLWQKRFKGSRTDELRIRIVRV